MDGEVADAFDLSRLLLEELSEKGLDSDDVMALVRSKVN